MLRKIIPIVLFMTLLDDAFALTPKYSMTYDQAGASVSRSSSTGFSTPGFPGTGQDKIMTYTSQNNLATVRGNKESWRYDYADSGFRLRRKLLTTADPSAPHQEFLNPGKYVSLEIKSSSTRVESSLTNHIYLNGIRIAAIGNRSGETSGAFTFFPGTGKPIPGIHYYLTDPVSSVKAILDGRGDTLAREEYFPFGESFIHEGQFSILPKFNSQERDAESNFDFFNARHYDSDITRFLTPDTLVDGESSAAGWNRYMYVKGSPVRFSDPSGHHTLVIFARYDTQAQTHTFLMYVPDNPDKPELIFDRDYDESNFGTPSERQLYDSRGKFAKVSAYASVRIDDKQFNAHMRNPDLLEKLSTEYDFKDNHCVNFAQDFMEPLLKQNAIKVRHNTPEEFVRELGSQPGFKYAEVDPVPDHTRPDLQSTFKHLSQFRREQVSDYYRPTPKPSGTPARRLSDSLPGIEIVSSNPPPKKSGYGCSGGRCTIL
jgi:RHS repeat-associated protein